MINYRMQARFACSPARCRAGRALAPSPARNKMRWQRIIIGWQLGVALAGAAELGPVALRVAGQLTTRANGFNLVEGRELSGPQGVAIDASATPPHIYVADTLNNRVLGWRDAGNFSSGAMADLVIGQPDFSGTGPNSPDVSIGLWAPAGVAVDGAGNLFVADTDNHRVLRYARPFEQKSQAPDLVVGQTNFRSHNRNMGFADPNSASLAYPVAVALSGQGDLAVSDSINHRVLIFRAGSLAASGPAADVVLGQVNFSASAGGAGLAGISQPGGVAFDQAGRLYVADIAANRVLVFSADAATGASAARIIGGNPDGAPRGPLTLYRPFGVAAAGDMLLVADTGNHRVLGFHGLSAIGGTIVAPDFIFGQPDFASALPNAMSEVRPLASARALCSPAQAVLGPDLTMFIADAGNNRVLAVPPAGAAYVQAARVLGQAGFTQNAPNLVDGREVSTANPLAVKGGFINASGGIVVDALASPPHVYIADTPNNRVLGWRNLNSLREGSRADIVLGQPDLETTVSNYGSAAAEDRPASPSNLNHPSGLALDAAGNLFVADTGNNRVLRFPRPFESPAAAADLVIGQAALSGYPVQGVSAFLLNHPTGIAVEPLRGDLAVADTLNHRVLLFAAPLRSGMPASQVLGQNNFVDSAPGLSSTALSFPTGVAFDSQDDIYVADTGNSRIMVFAPPRELPATGAAALASGPAPLGQPDFVTGVGGTAANRLRNPTGIVVNSQNGDLWVADTGNHRVLRFPPLPVLLTNGGAPYASGGLFGQASFTGRTENLGAVISGQTSPAGLSFPNAVGLDGSGNLLVGDGNARVLLYFPPVTAVSAATYLAGVPLAPGMLASIFGGPLAAETAQSGIPLATTLSDTQVWVNGAPAPLLYVSPGQINFQTPSNAPPGTTVRLEVVRPSSGQTIAGGSAAIAPAAAGIFGVLNEDNSPNSPANPAARGSVIQIFATGQGAVSGAPDDGNPAPDSPLATTPSAPVVTIGTSSQRDVVPDFSGLAPGFVGLWQINARVPAATAPGAQVPLIVRYRGSASNVVSIGVK